VAQKWTRYTLPRRSAVLSFCPDINVNGRPCEVPEVSGRAGVCELPVLPGQGRRCNGALYDLCGQAGKRERLAQRVRKETAMLGFISEAKVKLVDHRVYCNNA
jgi:hypothetical protein